MTDFELDAERVNRIGFGEAVYCAGKSPGQISDILRSVPGRPLLLTRLDATRFAALPEDVAALLDYDPMSQTAWQGAPAPLRSGAQVAVVTAGTSDLPVAREVVRTLRFSGRQATEIADVGVAGLWRLLRRVEELRAHPVVVVVAGMDAALPSVVAGLLPGVIIGVPTSVGYGVAAGGRAGLDAMLASCAPGLSVVNIDNGYGAACAALRVLGAMAPEPSERITIMDRRDFIKTVVAGVGVVAAADASPAMAQSLPPAVPDNVVPRPGSVTAAIPQHPDMKYRALGRTGEAVSLVGMGGYHLAKPGGMTNDEAIRVVHAGLDAGINFCDNCWDYNGGESEVRLGRALSQQGYRHKRLPDDQDRRPHREGGDGPDRDLADPPADRPSRPAAVPRDHPGRRSRPRVRAGRRA